MAANQRCWRARARRSRPVTARPAQKTAAASRKRQRIETSGATLPSCSAMAYQVKPQQKTTVAKSRADTRGLQRLQRSPE